MPTTGTLVEEYWHFHWKPSRYLLLVRILMPCVGAAALGLTTLPGASAWSGLTAVVLIVLALHAVHSHHCQPVGLLAEGDNMVVELLDGRRIAVRAVQIYCLPWLQVLRLRCWRGRGYTLVVAPDSADREQRHRWRYFLRYELPGSGGGVNIVSRASAARAG